MKNAAVAPAAATFTIGELAREFDLTTRAIRFYEEAGLLSPRREGRLRVYTQGDRTRLKLTQRGKRLGLSLAEIKELVMMYESPRDTVPQLRRYLEVLAEHRADIESLNTGQELPFLLVNQVQNTSQGQSGKIRQPYCRGTGGRGRSVPLLRRCSSGGPSGFRPQALQGFAAVGDSFRWP